MKKIIFGLIIILFFLSGYSKATLCVQSEHQDYRNRSNATIIALGTPIENTYYIEDNKKTDIVISMKIKIDKLLKGTDSEYITLQTDSYNSPTGLFEIGEQYIFYISYSSENKLYYPNPCATRLQNQGEITENYIDPIRDKKRYKVYMQTLLWIKSLPMDIEVYFHNLKYSLFGYGQYA